MKEITARAREAGTSPLTILNEEYLIDESAAPEWPQKAVTVGLPEGFDWHLARRGEAVTPVKMRIPQPENIKKAALAKSKNRS